MKRDRFEREDRLARLIHGLDIFLESRRGTGGAKLTIRVDQDRYGVSACRGHFTDAGNKRSCLSCTANPNAESFASSARVSDLDFMAAASELYSAQITQHCCR